MDAALQRIIGYYVTAILAGTLGGLLGIGGGVVMVPAVNLVFGENFHVAVAASLFCMVFLALSSAYGHWKNGYILENVLWELVPIAAVSAVVGVYLGSYVLPGWALNLLFAAFLAHIVYKSLRKLLRPGEEAEPVDRFTKPNRWIIPVIGAAMGLSCGILGIGGGVVAVPALHFFLKLPLKNAVANSSATILFSAAIAAVVKLAAVNGMTVTLETGELATLSWQQPIVIGLLMAPLALVFGRLGSHLTKISPTRLVRAVFVVVAIWACYKYAARTYADFQGYVNSNSTTQTALETAPAQ